jgi:hypothetical protein
MRLPESAEERSRVRIERVELISAFLHDHRRQSQCADAFA